ncbi:glycosyltransferase [Bosea sp. PAMC 26642]|uniref:glycosyltransferase n=1 Tax=Bosea sp. (strain PAMC 26642) TaxID=1792307 RepID=UPI000770042E|nr:glycosyltransferase [Bosea sp. PAMC 26642]AMJ62452.1 hypothetical protein AXW83_21030 [Bosea sp. PAMC 26642]
MSELSVSVILPCYNGEATISEQLDALCRQAFDEPWELVVVNNGSTDRSMAIVDGYRSRLPLRIVDAHDGVGARLPVDHSYRTGFAAAKGAAFILCEADDIVGDNWLAAMAEALTKHLFVAAALDYRHLNRPEQIGAETQSRESGLLTSAFPLFIPSSIGCAIGLQRVVYERIGGPEPECGASWDIDYSWKAQKAGFALHFVPNAVVHYRLREHLSAQFRQALNWGGTQGCLVRKYAAPLSAYWVFRYVGSGVKRVLRSAVKGPAAMLKRDAKDRWVWEMGWSIGFLLGARHLVGIRASR